MSNDIDRLLDKLREALDAETRRHNGVIDAYKVEITRLSADLNVTREKAALEENAKLQLARELTDARARLVSADAAIISANEDKRAVNSTRELHAKLQEENARLSAELDACRRMYRAFYRRATLKSESDSTCSQCGLTSEESAGGACKSLSGPKHDWIKPTHCPTCLYAIEALQGEAQTTGDLADRIRFACNALRERGDRYELAARRYKETIERLEQQNRGER